VKKQLANFQQLWKFPRSLKANVRNTASAKPRRKRILGVGRDAAALGVSRDWLRLVLNGDKSSLRLARRYFALKQKQRRRSRQKVSPNHL